LIKKIANFNKHAWGFDERFNNFLTLKVWKYYRYLLSLLCNKRDMKTKVLNVLGAVGSLGLAFGLVTGRVQEVINFEDSLNEMVMCALALMLGMLFTIAVFDKTK
jgi:hypothetical protein